MIDSLTISYSEFFRNTLTFAVLEKIVLPSIILKKKRANQKVIRIWSSACAAGQEPFSLAMILEELQIGSSEEITYRIFATDQCESLVNEARKGQFSADALNNLSFKRVKQWFTKNGNTYSIKPELKKNIEFSVYNLLDEQLRCPPASIFGDFDMVLCANLLFYYKKESIKIILEKVGSSLANGGYLITGQTERKNLVDYKYHEVFLQSAIFRLDNAGRRE